jgi:hypothetical protein
MVGVPIVKREYCDTWHLAQSLRIGTNAEIQEALVSYAASEHSRFVVQNQDPDVQTLMYGRWEKKQGIHLSNTIFLPYEKGMYSFGGYGYQSPSPLETMKSEEDEWIEYDGRFPSRYRGASVQTYNSKTERWEERLSIPSESSSEEEVLAFFARLDREEDEAQAALTGSMMPRGTHSNRRIEAQIDLATDAASLYRISDQDTVYERTYNHLHAMTDAEFEEVERAAGYGIHALEAIVDEAYENVEQHSYLYPAPEKD